MKLRIYNAYIVVTLSILFSAIAEEGLILLDDSSFEHLTQAATGATTGDWLVFMTPSVADCISCGKIEKELLQIKEKYQTTMSVAKLNPDAKITLRRFQVNKPTIMLFRRGYQWTYKGKETASSISDYIEKGHLSDKYKTVAKPLDWFDVWQEDFIEELKMSYKLKRLPSTHSLVVLSVGVCISFIVLFLACAPKKKHEKRK
ncbi:thioredoxin domain-containing protein isoform X2 [Hydra vulgaris]|uniref:Thioredoxin domain-containing protein isoform X2 n=1 Tax=Hydra vulgaris TaxID=6087 RepID=A0ABM4D8F0_HYDVU